MSQDGNTSLDNTAAHPSAAVQRRSAFARVMFALLWMLPTWIVFSMLVGMLVGGFAGAGTTSYQDGADAGRTAAQAFFQTYGSYVLAAACLTWIVLSGTGFYPGTAKWKRPKS